VVAVYEKGSVAGVQTSQTTLIVEGERGAASDPVHTEFKIANLFGSLIGRLIGSEGAIR